MKARAIALALAGLLVLALPASAQDVVDCLCQPDGEFACAVRESCLVLGFDDEVEMV